MGRPRLAAVGSTSMRASELSRFTAGDIRTPSARPWLASADASAEGHPVRRNPGAGLQACRRHHDRRLPVQTSCSTTGARHPRRQPPKGRHPLRVRRSAVLPGLGWVRELPCRRSPPSRTGRAQFPYHPCPGHRRRGTRQDVCPGAPLGACPHHGDGASLLSSCDDREREGPDPPGRAGTSARGPPHPDHEESPMDPSAIRPARFVGWTCIRPTWCSRPSTPSSGSSGRPGACRWRSSTRR
jgi:hypothetical protein